jgi:hypothetical protein
MYMVGHEMPFQNLTFLLLRQRVENRAQLPTDLAEDGLAPSFGHEHDVILAVPFGMGQALINV